MHKSLLNPSQLSGEYTAQLLPFRRIGLINQLCPHRYPFTPGWREAIMVKCLAQGHKNHGCGRDSNPHSDDSAIRTQIQCTPRSAMTLHARPWHSTLGHGTPRSAVALHARPWHSTLGRGTPRSAVALHARPWHSTLGRDTPRSAVTLHARPWHSTWYHLRQKGRKEGRKEVYYYQPLIIQKKNLDQ